MNKILIIGGNGYIGSSLYTFLTNKNLYCDIVDTNRFGKINKCTELDYNNLQKDFLDKYDSVVLLAGYSSVGMCTNYYDTFNENVIKFINLIKKINKNHLLIYASSSSVYGIKQDATENDELTPPINNYDFSKQSIDYINKFSDKNIVGLRFGTVCGYSPNFRRDLVINSMTLNALNNNELQLSNKNNMRTILGITDLCNGIYHILLNRSKISSKIYNFGSFSCNIGSIADNIKKLTNCNIIYNDKFITNYSFTISSKKFMNDFDFKFEETLESIFLSIKNNINNITNNKVRSI